MRKKSFLRTSRRLHLQVGNKLKPGKYFPSGKTLFNLFLFLLLIFLLQLLRLQQTSLKDQNQRSVLADGRNSPICTQFVATPATGGAQLKVTFTGQGSSPNGKIIQVRFVFGDESEEIQKQDFGSQVEVVTSHLYKLPGTYVASFFLSNEQGIEVGGGKNCQARITVQGETLPAVKG